LDDPERITAELNDVRAAGGRVLVEATPIGLGRRPELLHQLARDSGLVIVATSGFHKEAYYPVDHWVRKATTEQMVDLVLTDVRDGMDGTDFATPWRAPTEIRAGMMKVATELHHMTALQRRMFTAVAQVHMLTGAPITTHCEAGTLGLEQVACLTDMGVAARSISVGHVDKNPDLGYLRAIAETGAFLVFSNPGRVKYGPDDLWLTLMGRLAEDGHLRQLLVGGDMAPRSMWRSYGGGPGIGWLFSGFYARLRDGLGDDLADAVTIDNPRRALAVTT
jgi:phosphotriesterase-related protein